MKRRLRIRRDNHRLDKLTKAYHPKSDECLAFEYGVWIVVFFDYLDIGIGFQKFECGGMPLHKHHKVAYAMIRKWHRSNLDASL